MAKSLNPDAPSFNSSHNLVPSSLLQLAPQKNTNPYHPYSSPYAVVYFEVQTTHFGTICSYAPPPQYSPYQLYSYPRYDATLQLPWPQYASALPQLTIEELDENPGADPKSDTPNKMVAPEPIGNIVVVNRRRIRAQKEERSIIRAPRYQEVRRRSSVKVSHRNYEISTEADFERDGKTTVMIRNLPSKFSKGRMLAILRDHCIKENKKVMASLGDQAVLSEFDYFYLPIDFGTNSNFGFAFVNFTSPIGASRLYKHLHNHRWTAAGSNKVCAVNYARIQGLAKSIEHADQMTFGPCVPAMFLPVHYEPPYSGLNKCEEIPHGKRIM